MLSAVLKFKSIKFYFAFLVLSSVATPLHAKQIRLSDDELSQEAIMPVFDEKLVIKNRRVSHKGKLEFGLFGGNVLSEAMFDPMTFGGSIAYHFDNTHGFFATVGVYQDKLRLNEEVLCSLSALKIFCRFN